MRSLGEQIVLFESSHDCFHCTGALASSLQVVLLIMSLYSGLVLGLFLLTHGELTALLPKCQTKRFDVTLCTGGFLYKHMLR